MPEECSNGEAPPLPPSKFIAGDDSTLFEDGFGWKAVAIGYGCGFMFGVIMNMSCLKQEDLHGCASSDTEWSWLWNNTKVADSTNS
ncbi:hypothetical protein NC651_027951 [Populus alba x Populus x berolinensis]|nr:hypothetical protein NC651_027951 [Populus alba x Populus x berolinensis]